MSVIDIEKVTVSIENVTENSLSVQEVEDITVEVEEIEKLQLSVKDTDEISVSIKDMLVVEKGENIVRQMIVGETFIDAYKAVYLDNNEKIKLYNTSDSDLLGKFVGVTLESGNYGEVIPVQLSGIISNSLWAFSKDSQPVYVGLSGNITTVLPMDSVFSHEIGVTITENSFLLEPKLAVSENQEYIKVTAGENINGQRVVRTDATGKIYLASDDPLYAFSIFGVSVQAIIDGSSGYVLKEGILEEPSWNWIPTKPLYFDSIGRITHIPQTTGFVCCIGYAITETKILVRINQPIFL